MKKGSIIIALTILGASMLSPSMAQSYYIEDDIYYTPGEENPVIEQKKKEKEAEAAAAATTATATNTTSLERDVDEYNRRGSYNDEANTYTDATDGTTTGTTFTYYSDEVAPGDTVYIQPEEGYYLNDFNGSLNDYEYTIRIHRFYDPRYAISIGDPAYTNIYFLDSNDWNVYIDGNYAWVTPTWTNPWYWNYMWAPYSYSSWAWRWNYGWTSWGFYDPWYYSYGWGYPYYGYYGWGYPYYGWNHPHYGWHNDWYYTANGRGPRQWRNDAPARPSSSNNRYGGTYTAGARGNSLSSRREGTTTGSSSGSGTRGQRYSSSTSDRNNIESAGRRNATTINSNSGRRGTSDANISTINSGRRGVTGTNSTGTSSRETVTNRRPSTLISTTGNTSLRGNSTAGRTTINTQGTSVSRPSSTSRRNYTTPSSTTRNSYSPSRGNSSRSSVGSSRGSYSGSRSSSMSSGRSSGGSRGRR